MVATLFDVIKQKKSFLMCQNLRDNIEMYFNTCNLCFVYKPVELVHMFWLLKK